MRDVRALARSARLVLPLALVAQVSFGVTVARAEPLGTVRLTASGTETTLQPDAFTDFVNITWDYDITWTTTAANGVFPVISGTSATAVTGSFTLMSYVESTYVVFPNSTANPGVSTTCGDRIISSWDGTPSDPLVFRAQVVTVYDEPLLTLPATINALAWLNHGVTETREYTLVDGPDPLGSCGIPSIGHVWPNDTGEWSVTASVNNLTVTDYANPRLIGSVVVGSQDWSALVDIPQPATVTYSLRADVPGPIGGGPTGGDCTGVCSPVPSATPELNSLALLASGMSGLGGYALLRLRARRGP